MRVKILASALLGSNPTVGPFKTLDIVEVDAAYQIGDATHYGPVVMIAPDIPPFNVDAEQSVVVNLDSATPNSYPDESIYPKPPSSYNKIEFFPILVDTFGYPNDEPPPRKGSAAKIRRAIAFPGNQVYVIGRSRIQNGNSSHQQSGQDLKDFRRAL